MCKGLPSTVAESSTKTGRRADEHLLSTNVFCIFGQMLQFVSNIDWLVVAYNQMFHHCAVMAKPQEVITLRELDGIYGLRIPGRVSEKFLSISNMVEAFKYRVVFENVWNSDHRPLLFHASVVARNGRAAIICGRTNAGKTTLALESICRGYQYLSDEIGVFDSVSRVFIPNPFPIAVRWLPDELESACEALDNRLHESQKDERIPLRTVPLSANGAQSSAVPSVFVFLDRGSSAEVGVWKLGREQGIDMLLQHCYTRGNAREHRFNMGALDSVTQHASFIRLHGGNQQETVEAFGEILSSSIGVQND